MLRLALMLSECDIPRRTVLFEAHARGYKLARRTIVALLNDGVWPRRESAAVNLRTIMDELVLENAACMNWLNERGLKLTDAYVEIEASGRFLTPKGHAERVSQGMLNRRPAIEPGDPLKIESKEENMITESARKYFKMFRCPFEAELRSAADLYTGAEHVFLREMMLEAAKNCGFVALPGECGCGKSTMRMDVASRLIKDGVKVIFPQIVDQSRITPVTLVDAIIMDLSEEAPKRSLEAKTRQAIRLLQLRQASNLKQVLIIDEAHRLSVGAIKALKQIYEFGAGFERLMGIILIGQPELKALFDETRHPELREVIRRCTLAEISDLGDEYEAYLQHKLVKVGSKIEGVFEPEAVKAIGQRLKGKCYPLSVNQLCAAAINNAVRYGEDKVTAEIVLAA